MKASQQHDREWDEEKARQTWTKKVRDAQDITSLIPLISQLDEGMSLPTSLCTRYGQNGEPNKVQRVKLQLFKFWPSQDMKQAWKSYEGSAGSLSEGNLNALYIMLRIMHTACD